MNVEVLFDTTSAQTLPNVLSLDGCGEDSAWYYDDGAAPTRIRMCPSACESISSGGAVQILLGCETKTISLD